MPWRKRTIESFFLLVHQKQEPIRGNKSDYHFSFLFPFTLGLFLVFSQNEKVRPMLFSQRG